MTTRGDVVDAADGKLSLREAITRANTHAGADTIVLPTGVCRVSIAGAGENANATGDLDITDTVTIQGAGAGVSVVDGQQIDRVLHAFGPSPSSIRVVLQGLTVRNGLVTGDGGGISVGNADLVLRDSVVSGNRSSLSGGGISNGAAPGTGNVTLVRSTASRNVAGTFGGGVQVSGVGSALTVNNSAVRRNVATGNAGGIGAVTVTLTGSAVSDNLAGGTGGGIAAFTSATLTGSTVSGNSAGTDGGGISTDTVTLTGSTVSGNSASGTGGGIRFVTSATVAGSTISGNSAGDNGGGLWGNTLTLTNSTVSGNSAFNIGGASGGGITASTLTLTNSTVSGNTASTNGGGIAVGFLATLTNGTISGNSAGANGGGLWAVGDATLLNVTVVENIAHSGGGVFHNPAGTFSVRNSIIALNLVDFTGTAPDASGNFTSAGHNLIGDGSGSTGFGINFDIVGTSANAIDPKIDALKNNGGSTKTHALLAGSPAIDKGDNAGVPATDQRGAGFARKKDGDGNGSAIVDIGAFEV